MEKNSFICLPKSLVRVSLVLVILASALSLHFLWWCQEKVTLSAPAEFELLPGTSLRHLSHALASEGIVSNGTYFWLYGRLLTDYSRFQAGTYLYEGAVSPLMVVQSFLLGETYQPVVLEVTIPEGWTLKQIIERGVHAGIADQETFESVARSPSFLESFADPVLLDGLEGFLYPATYRFHSRMPSPQEYFKKMVETFHDNLPPDYGLEVGKMGLTLREAVVFASLIERETSLDEERPLIAEVIWRRLRTGITLGIDASIIYGLGADYRGNLTRAHLRDSQNIFNTRIHKGLPPSPIGSPARRSLEAVLHPGDNGYLFYVLIPSSPTRSHHFSKTLAEHNQFVRELVRATKQ